MSEAPELDGRKPVKMDAADYYKLRMEHTIQHLQQVTRLVYFIGGAVVAMFYFIVDKLNSIPEHRILAGILLLLLGTVNLLHTFFILVQADWYRKFDEELIKCTKAEKITRGKVWLTSRRLWASIHALVAVTASSFGLYFIFAL